MTLVRGLGRSLIWLHAAWLVALAGETGVHLVHHLFDDDDGAQCEFLAGANHAPGQLAPAPILVSLPRSAETPPPVPAAPSSAGARVAPSSRAPPGSRTLVL